MPDLQTYETTKLDWNAIKSLAVRAARETPLRPAPAIGYVNRSTNEFIDVCGPHWLLDHRWCNWETTETHRIEEGRSEDLYVLMSDGQLLKIWISENTTIGRESSWRKFDDSQTVRPMAEDDIVSFDFGKSWHEFGELGTPEGKVWGDDDRGPTFRGPLLQTSKGAGLCRLLENVRTGRAKQAEGLIIPSQETGDTRTQLLPGLTKFHHTPDKRAKVIADLRRAREKAAGDRAAAAHAEGRQARMREIRSAFSAAGHRALLLAGVWLLVSFVVFANNSDMSPSPGFADGSYSVVTWSLIFALIGGLIIDLFVGRGHDGAFLAGAAVGIAVLVYSVLSKPNVADHPADISLFWLTALFGLIAYLLSSLVRRSRGPRKRRY